jgi:glycerophosphoryl diester phosphodiesterase
MHPVLNPARSLVFAHRGGAALRPENTLPAFEHGLALGADGLELDVQLSGDGVVVVCHDLAVDRTTNGTGPIAGKSWQQLAGLDAGWSFGAEQGYPFRGRGFGIPRLSDVLACVPACPLIIELKGTDLDLAGAAVREVRQAGALDRVCFGSFSVPLLKAARACGGDVVTSGGSEEIARALRWSWIGVAPPGRAYRALQVPECYGATRIVSRRFVAAMRRADVAVQVWTVNEADDMRRLLDWGVNALITDRPDVAVEVVREEPRT